ncbi:MAG: hypothetical protein K0R65_2422 [Crocinitomicaceae bacterium]|jgi:LEA14-like dessication related protein|nr:hypothetical protein [Crocinitomicaceae bacterium]
MKKLLYFIVLTILLVSCEFHELDFDGMDSYKMEKFEDNKLHVLLRLKIGNENWFKLKIKPSFMTVSVDGKELGVVYLDEKVKIKKKTNDIYEAKIHLELADGAMFMLPTLMAKQQVNLTFEGNVKGKVFIFGKKIKVKETRTIDTKSLLFNFFQ